MNVGDDERQKRPAEGSPSRDTNTKPKTMRHTYDPSKNNNQQVQQGGQIMSEAYTGYQQGYHLQQYQQYYQFQDPYLQQQQIYNHVGQQPQQVQAQYNVGQQPQQVQPQYNQQSLVDPNTAAYWAAYGAAYAQYSAMWYAQGSNCQPQPTMRSNHGYNVSIPPPPIPQNVAPAAPPPPLPPPPAPYIGPAPYAQFQEQQFQDVRGGQQQQFGGRVGARDARMSTKVGMKNPNAQQRGVALNKQIIQCQGDPFQIFKLVGENWNDMDEVNIATSFYQLGKAEHSQQTRQWLQHHVVFHQLVEQADAHAAKFSARNISNIIYAIGKMEISTLNCLLDSLCNQIMKKLEQFNPQNIANVLWSFGNMGYKPAQIGQHSKNLLDLMSVRAKEILKEFSPQNISNSVLAFVKLSYVSEDVRDLLHAIGKQCVHKVPQFNPQALSNTAWGLSKLDIWLDEFMSAVREQSISLLPQFVPQNIGNIMWAWANAGQHPGEEFLYAIVHEMPRVAGEMTGQNLCNVLWGCAKLGFKNNVLEQLVQENGVRVVSRTDCPPQTAANLMWSFGALDRNPGAELTSAISNHVMQNFHAYSPQQIANTLWGFATLNIYRQDLLKSLADDINVRLSSKTLASQFQTQNLSNILWSFATLEYKHESLLQELARIIQERLQEFLQQEIVNCLWAMAKLGSYHESLMDVIGDYVVGGIEEFTCQHICMTIYAYGKLTHEHKGVLSAVADTVIKKIEELDMPHICNVLYAFAILNYQHKDCVFAIKSEIEKRDREGQQFSGQQCCNILWSLAILEQLTLQHWTMLFKHLLNEDQAKLLDSSYTQIYLAYLILRMSESEDSLCFGGEIIQKGYEQFRQDCSQVHVSKLHQAVSKCLHHLQVPHRNDSIIEQALFSADIILEDTIDNQKVMLEVDGPSHFSANTNMRLGANLVRNKLLEHRGWVVLSVPFYKWQQMNTEEQQEFVKTIISPYCTLNLNGEQPKIE